jgi:predicted nucleic acid-binding protein
VLGWLRQRVATPGVLARVPAVADYEARREAERKGARTQLARLADLLALAPTAPVTDDAWIKAAEFWALVRQGGLPTAHPEALDGDALLAGVADTLGGEGGCGDRRHDQRPPPEPVPGHRRGGVGSHPLNSRKPTHS